MLNVALFWYHRRCQLTCFHYLIRWPFFVRFAPNKIHFTLHLVVIFSVYWLRYDLLYLYVATCIYFIRFLTQCQTESVSLEFSDYTKYQQFHHYNWFDSDRKWMLTLFFFFWLCRITYANHIQVIWPLFQRCWLFGEKYIDIDFNYNGSSSIILIRIGNYVGWWTFRNFHAYTYLSRFMHLFIKEIKVHVYVLLSFRGSEFFLSIQMEIVELEKRKKKNIYLLLHSIHLINYVDVS